MHSVEPSACSIETPWHSSMVLVSLMSHILPRGYDSEVARIRVTTTISVPPKAVWAAISDISTHVNWMDDAVAIRFTSHQRQGAGTTFDCDTEVGPFSLVDRMTITEWKPNRVMGVRHEGIVKGTGRFTLRRARGGRTRFTWDERLV